MLSDDDSDISNNEELHQLTVNQHYAKAFEYRKEREELAKLKEKYGSDFENEDESDSESDESEDEYGEELTPAVDAALLRTLAKIRRKDPEIYDSNVGVFDEEAKQTQGKTLTRTRPVKDKSKPLTIKQQNIAALLESGSRPQSPTSEPAPLTHAQEQAALRDETVSAFHNAVQDDADDLLTLREGVKDETEQREEEYREFLQREVGGDISQLLWIEEGGVKVKEVSKPAADEQTTKKEQREKKKGKHKERKQETDEEFLMNYILNRGWIDKSENRAPTYKEIVGVESKAKAKEEAKLIDGQVGEGGDLGHDLLDEDEFDEVADHFESTYNFRFEEPNAHVIATHPRNVTSVRRTDTTRKDAREKKKERKAEKMLAKKEEVKRLKSLKTRELKDKLEKIRMEGGLGKHGGKRQPIEEDEGLEDYGALGNLDLDGDWDPDQHDAQMKSLYAENEEYEDDAQKPTWEDDIDISDLIPKGPTVASEAQAEKKKKRKKRNHDEDREDAGVDPDEMDAEVERPVKEEDEEEWDGTEEMRKRVLEKHMGEMDDLEFNDMVGDMPTHFRYARVEPSTYGLTSVEILNATDAELNTYMGLKRIVPYRKDKFDYRRPEKLKEFRNALGARGVFDHKGTEGSGQSGERAKQRKGKKERQKEKAQAAMEEVIKQEAQAQQEEGEPNIKKRKRKHKKGEEAEASV